MVQLVKRNGPTAIEVYGSGDELGALARRIRTALPDGRKLQEHEVLALAQLAIAYRLNPFNGEVWYIPGKGAMVGIKGLRKAARAQSHYFTRFEPLDEREKEARGIDPRCLAYRCLVYRHDAILQAAEAIRAMREAGVADAHERFRYEPTEGIGLYRPGESTKMEPVQVAMKRAEADALKRAFDLPFGVGEEDEDAPVMDAAPSAPRSTPIGAPPDEPVEKSIADLYGDEPATGDEVPEWVAELRRRAAVGRQEPATQAQIGLVAGKLAEATEWKDEGRHTFLRIVFGKNSAKDLTWGEARAVLDWLIAYRDEDTGDYVIRPEAAQQMAELIQAEQERMGQQELPLEG